MVARLHVATVDITVTKTDSQAYGTDAPSLKVGGYILNYAESPALTRTFVDGG